MATLRTLGEAYSAGWGIRVRCQRSDQRGIVKVDPCRFEATHIGHSQIGPSGGGLWIAQSEKSLIDAWQAAQSPSQAGIEFLRQFRPHAVIIEQGRAIDHLCQQTVA